MSDRDDAYGLDEDDIKRMLQVVFYRMARIEGFLGIPIPPKHWVNKMLGSDPKAGEELREALKAVWPSPPPLEVIESWSYPQRVYMTEYAALTEALRNMPDTVRSLIPPPRCPDWLGAWFTKDGQEIAGP